MINAGSKTFTKERKGEMVEFLKSVGTLAVLAIIMYLMAVAFFSL